MPSASPLYTFSSVFTEPETPNVLTHIVSSEESNNSNISISNNDNSISNACIVSSKNGSLVNNSLSFSISNNMGKKNGGPVDNNACCKISNSDSKDSPSHTYDPFKCMSDMAEQSLTGNFTHSSSGSTIAEVNICNSREKGCTSRSCSVIPVNNINIDSAFMDIELPMRYPPCDKKTYLSISPNSTSSSSPPPLSPTLSKCIFIPTPIYGTSNGFLSNSSSTYHKNNENQSNDFFISDNTFCQRPATNHNSAGFGVISLRSTCGKSYPSCTSELALEDNDRILSWTLQHPEAWTNSEVLDWVFFVAQDRGLDMQEFRGENFQGYSGTQLCHMEMDDFAKLEPKFGKIIYGMFRRLLCGVVFQQPVDPEHLNSSCEQLSPYSPAASSKISMDIKNYPQSLYHVSGIDVDNCNGTTQTTFFKQERCSNVENGSIDITSYDFDLNDTPCIPTPQCQDQFHQDYGMYPAQYQQNSVMRASCCFPAPALPGQLPRRKPGRPRVKSLMDDDRVSKEKKVKNQHLWEFIYETLMNPVYNPQFLRWENQREGVFRFVQSEAVAQLWGGRKNNENMTYEKLSRAMRHYYRRGILERVEGRRLVYKFSLKAMERIREKRNSV